MQAFIRIVNIGGQFQKTKEEVEEILICLNKIKFYDRPLISIKDGPEYIEFDMPAHKYFLKQIGFEKYKMSNGWRTLNGYLKQINQTDKVYKFPKLDQWQLLEKLQDLPLEELTKIKPGDLQYPWMLRNAKPKT